MRRRIGIMALTLSSLIALTGCTFNNTNTPQTSNSQQNNNESLGNQNKIEKPSYTELNYSNMVDKEMQEEIKKILIKNNINKDYVEKYFDAVNTYNNMYSGDLPNTSGFSISEKSQVPYDTGAFQGKWTELNDKYIDINCRISSLRLFNDFIESEGEFEGDEIYIAMDLSTIEDNPEANFDKASLEKFKKVFAAINVEKFGNDQEIANIISNEWDKRGVKFKDNENVTLITGFSKDEEFKEVAIGHVGVAVKNGDEILFIEKYAPAMPYQVTKFKDMEEVRSYMFDRMISTEGDSALPRPIIMENNKLMK